MIILNMVLALSAAALILALTLFVKIKEWTHDSKREKQKAGAG